MSEHKSRRPELSALNVLFCLCVMLIHVMSNAVTFAPADSSSYVGALLTQRICAFAVQGFVLSAGVKVGLSCDRPIRFLPYYIGRVKRVILPYLAACAVYTFVYTKLGYVEFSWGSFLHSLADGSAAPHLYFVVLIVQFYLLVPVWRGLVKWMNTPERTIFALLTAFFAQTVFGQNLVDLLTIPFSSYWFPYSDRVFTAYLFYWVLGLAVGRYYDRVTAALSDCFVPVTALFALVCAHHAHLSYLHFSGKTTVYWLENVHVFYVFSAVLFFLALAGKLSKTKLFARGPLVWIDRASYSVYLWHVLVMNLADYFIISELPLSMDGGTALRALIVYGVTLPVCAGAAFGAAKLKALAKSKKE